MVHCNLTLINNLLFTNWNAPELKKMLLVNLGFWGQRIDLWYGLPALQGIMRLNTDGKIEAKKLFSYKMHQDHCARPVSVLDFPIPLPKIDRREPHSKWCFSPSYLNPNPEGLVDVSTFAHLTSDLDKIRNHFEKIGFTKSISATSKKRWKAAKSVD
ncbi:hypothetical protein L596_026157 [Steinernema carpocapsae]|uniref:Uncharacterized protein n=1 Tax=Steinernema carpocapsae TaxID=34508 RepID=A0A4U5M0M4_STECR|nr:hypothetical protein L596_026157 [Steinernema carpocapsae]